MTTQPTFEELEHRVKVLEGELIQSHKKMEALERSEELYRILFENSPNMIYLLDLAGNVLIVNQRSADQFAAKPEEIIGRNIAQLFPKETAERHKQAIEKVKRDGQILRNEMVEPFPAGERWIDASIVPVHSKENGEITAVLGISNDITDRKHAEEELYESRARYRELSIIDDLTQLYNSRHFHHQLGAEVDRADRYKQPLTLMLLDVDDFKVFNDTYGHVAGDHVLSRLGQVIKGCLRRTDSAYRYGGEEFTILLPMTTCDEGVIIGDRIRTEFKKEVFHPSDDQNVHVTVSMGLTQHKPHEDMETFVRRADNFMYRAKKNGKDQIFYESDRQEAFRW